MGVNVTWTRRVVVKEGISGWSLVGVTEFKNSIYNCKGQIPRHRPVKMDAAPRTGADCALLALSVPLLIVERSGLSQGRHWELELRKEGQALGHVTQHLFHCSNSIF